ncbi:MAG: hypothetical protein WCH35_15435 [Comamonadaceae bacterium]
MKSIIDYLEKYGKLSLRERLLVLFAVLVALYFVLDAALLTPQLQRIKKLNQSVQLRLQERDTLTAQLVLIEGEKSKAIDLAQGQRDELDALQKQIAAADVFYRQPGQQGSGLGALLRGLLASNPRVTLAGLKTQPASVFFAPGVAVMGEVAAKNVAPSKDTVYRAGVEVSLKGSFSALLAYLQTLEQRSDRLFWSAARLDVASYPEAVLKLEISTLGSDASAPLN